MYFSFPEPSFLYGICRGIRYLFEPQRSLDISWNKVSKDVLATKLWELYYCNSLPNFAAESEATITTQSNDDNQQPTNSIFN